ncbi:hypothetical protein SLEP1_g28948 [Rubroshorea leprosula]|uniref:Inositol polyphosphate multikinase n=1 Tax=Rubroshorea leprosula TaxID=152421 RepID=A0AAV5K4X0_9ROSI|nr:hypothetical protein SLEP1_g28948 [Rubroshorea leprosula]
MPPLANSTRPDSARVPFSASVLKLGRSSLAPVTAGNWSETRGFSAGKRISIGISDESIPLSGFHSDFEVTNSSLFRAHRASDGKLGPLIDDSGRFYKPLQVGELGSREVAFYRDFSTNAEIPDYIRKFFPVFYGTETVEASNGSGLCSHLVLQDLVSGRYNPSVVDIKIGSRTWYPEACEDCIEKCLKKDRKSTSVSLGFRISGLRVFESKESGFWKLGKKQVSNFTSRMLD